VGFTQSAEWKDVEACDGLRQRRWRQGEVAHHLVRPAVDQKAAAAPDLAAQRADRISDAAAKREFCQCGRRCRTRKADGHRQLDAARVERSKKGKNRRGLEAELGDDIEADIGLPRPVPPGC
jgi:hypothetical protein